MAGATGSRQRLQGWGGRLSELRFSLPGYAVGIVGVGLASLAIGLLGPNVRTSEMLYLVPVVFVATRWGIRPAVAASLAAFLIYDSLFVLPLGLLPSNRPDDLLTLAVLLFTAIVTGQLGAWARRVSERAREAELLRQTDELKSALLHAVSHDLRTPLASIKAAVTGLLQSGARLDETDRHELLSAIDEETDRLTHLVSNLLDLSRIEAGSLRAEKDWYDLREVVEAVVQRLAPLAARRDVRISVQGDLPLVPLDHPLAERVMVNLLENAVRYSPPTAPIEVKLRADERFARVEVADRGPGVPAAERERIFGRFYQSGRRAGGVGLGLAIARGMVEAHGGRLWYEPRLRGGSRFVFTLPLGDPSPTSSAVRLRQRRGRARPRALGDGAT
jgi:K+-sensing histidine kinase KdpD